MKEPVQVRKDFVERLRPRSFRSGGRSAEPAVALSSISAITGPGGAARALLTSRELAWPARSVPIVSAALATGRPSAPWSSRWWLTRPASAARTVSEMTTREAGPVPRGRSR